MTEDEAMTKACPFASVFDPGNGDTPKCVGPGCMAWVARTRTEYRLKDSGQPVEKNTIILRGSAENVSVLGGGLCGLAGRPS